VTTGVFLAVTLMTAHPDARVPQNPPPATAEQQAPPAVQPPAPVVAPLAPPDPQRRREQIGVMEGVLAEAVKNGARRAGRDFQPNLPGVLSLTGQARARGFILEGYGVFFDVEIPSLLKSVAWMMQSTERDLKSAADTLQSLRDRAAPQRAANAARTDDAVIELPVVDPDALYHKSVIAACVDAMIEWSNPMDVQPEEWLTVALRGTEGQTAPGELSETHTVLLRVKGTDLSDFRAGRISREDARKKVVIREF
jgi:hypothetical protein